METTFRKIDLVKELAGRAQIQESESTKLINEFIKLVAEKLKQGVEVNIHGFGKFYISDRAERKGRNPKTGEAIIIPASKTLSFSTSSIVKAQFNVKPKESVKPKEKKATAKSAGKPIKIKSK